MNSCDAYLTANGYGAAKDMASFKTALASSVSEIGITAAFTVNEDVNLNGKKIYPAGKYTGSAQCVAAGKPTLTIGKSVNLGNGRIENMNLALKADSNAVKFFTGCGTFKDTSISYSTDKAGFMNKGYLFDVNACTVNMEGTNKIVLSTTSDIYDGYAQFTGGTLNINGPLMISGNPSLELNFAKGSKFNIANTGSLTYTAGANYSIFEGRENSTMILNGPVIVTPGKGNPKYPDGNYMVFELWSSSLSLKGSGNKLETGNSAFYAQQTSSVTIDGSVSISAIGTRTDRTLFDMDSNAAATLNAPVTITGFQPYTGDAAYESIRADHITEWGGKYTFNSTITTTGGIVDRKYAKGDVFTAQAYLNGISKIKYEQGTVSFQSGARIRMGGVCRKATSAASKGTSYTLQATSANNLGAPFSGGC